MAKFKVGDTVKCIYDDKGGVEFVGEVGKVTAVLNTYYPYRCSGNLAGPRFAEDELALVKPYAVQFILQYELDEDPFETFETFTEVEERIKELSSRADLKRDSIKVYEIAKTYDVSLETKVNITTQLPAPTEETPVKKAAKKRGRPSKKEVERKAAKKAYMKEWYQKNKKG